MGLWWWWWGEYHSPAQGPKTGERNPVILPRVRAQPDLRPCPGPMLLSSKAGAMLPSPVLRRTAKLPRRPQALTGSQLAGQVDVVRSKNRRPVSLPQPLGLPLWQRMSIFS